MSYAIRNTLVLAILFILVAAGGGYWVFSRQLGELKGIRQDQDEVSREIEEMGDVHAVLEEITAKLEEAKERWRHREKVIPPVDNPADTYAYLNRIVSRTGTAVRYNFRFRDSGGDSVLSWNRYDISDGYGSYARLYGFLWRLENQRRLYRIEELTVQEETLTDERTGQPRSRVRFNCQLMAYFMPGTDPHADEAEFLRLTSLSRDPFRPLLYEDVPLNTENLLEVDKAQLLAIVGEMIYVRDQGGETRYLQLGDRVYLGHLAEVDHGNSRVMFVLNKAGLTDYVTLGLSGSAD